MKKYIKPSLEYFELTSSVRLMGLGDPSTPGTNVSTTPENPETGQGFAPRRRIF